jgi:hypothetical protein
METDRNSVSQEVTRAIGKRPELDEVNDASFDSFPASDAPVWSSMHAGPPRLRVSSPPSNPPAAADKPASPKD